MHHRVFTVLNVVALISSGLLPTTQAAVPFTLEGPGVDPNDFRVTEFASGLNFPVGITELQDGSVLVAVDNGNDFFGSSSGDLVRLVDTDNDGVSDVQQTLINDVPGGKLSALRRSGDLLFVTGQGAGVPITIYRTGAQPSDTPTLLGTITISYSGGWLHPHSALGVRETPGVANSHDLFFQLGSRTNFDDTTQTRPFTSTIGSSGNLAGDAIHMIRITDDGEAITGANPVQIATGLRNPAGMAFHPETGDLYLQDNGIDGVVVAIEPTSADELNVIAAADVGGAIEDFGFPTTYEEYRTGTKIGDTGIDPLVTFQPIPPPNGAEAEGPNDIAFAPPGFPAALRNGMFVGMHGQFSSGGVANEENPLVFVDLSDNSYFHIIANDIAGVGHLDGLLSTEDSLFVADMSPSGGLGSGQRDSGVIYQIKSLVSLLTADFDKDGDVDGNDFLLWQANFGTATGATSNTGDADADGDVDGDDFLLWQAEFGTGTGANGASVPEPTAIAIVTLLLAAGTLRRRNH